MKLLIMVLSYTNPPYADLMQTQLGTWASILDIRFTDRILQLFYHGGYSGLEPKYYYDGTLELPCTDEYYKMAGKFKLALEFVNNNGWEYDLIFRTNSSSYVNKEELLKFAEKLPLEKCYAGWTFVDSEDFGGLCVSGAGIWLSRDCAEILMNEIDLEKEIEEDVYIGRILRKHGIEAIDDKSRVDIDSVRPYDEIPLNRFHYRFKGIHGDRLKDAENMRKIHQLIINNG
jgi:hypothetical protein